MKILIIHHFGGIGGGFKSCIDIARMIKECGHKVTIALPRLDNAAENILKKSEIKFRTDIPDIIELNYHSASSLAFFTLIKYFISLKNKNKWEKFFLAENYDVIILNSLVQVPLIKYIKKYKKKSILFIRETMRKNKDTFINKLLLKKIMEFDAVSFLTEYDQKTWRITKGPIQVVIPDIVDKSYFSDCFIKIENKKIELGIKKNSLCFLYLGGLCYIKGALDLLLAFDRYLSLGNEGHLFILGSDYKQFFKLGFLKKFFHKKDILYTQQCLDTIKKINETGNNITFVGLTEKPEEWYLISDIVIFPVKKVHQARPIYEAGFFKKTVIVPSFPHFREAVIDDYNGLYYQSGSVEDLSEKMIELSKSIEKRNKLAEHNEIMYKEKHTFEKVEFKIGELLKNLNGLK